MTIVIHPLSTVEIQPLTSIDIMTLSAPTESYPMTPKPYPEYGSAWTLSFTKEQMLDVQTTAREALLRLIDVVGIDILCGEDIDPITAYNRAMTVI